MFLLMYVATFLEFLDLVLNVETQDEMSDNFYVLSTMLSACYKMFSMVKRNKNFTDLTDILEKKPFQPENEEEVEIRKTYHKAVQ